MNKIRLIVIHSTAGGFDSSLKILRGWTDREVSSHYLINTDGKIHQLVDENERAWHAADLNNISIGIEIVDNAKTTLNDYLTGEQYISILRLVRNIATRYNIPKQYVNFDGFDNLSNNGRINKILSDKNIKGIIFHREVSTVTKMDPTGFDKEKFINDLNTFSKFEEDPKYELITISNIFDINNTLNKFYNMANDERENYRKLSIDSPLPKKSQSDNKKETQVSGEDTA